MKAKFLWMAVLSAALTLSAQAQDAPGAQMGAGGMGRGPGGNFQGTAGEITKIDGSTLTITTFRGETAQVSVSDSTKITKNRAEAKLTDLKVGDRIMARGQQDKNGVWVAEVLHVGMPGGPGGQGGQRMNPADNGKTYILGTVSAVSGVNITVQKPDGSTQTIAVDDDTSFHNPQRESITLADVKAGNMVRGQGAVKDGVFVARELTAGAHHQGPPPDGSQGAPQDGQGAPPSGDNANETR